MTDRRRFVSAGLFECFPEYSCHEQNIQKEKGRRSVAYRWMVDVSRCLDWCFDWRVADLAVRRLHPVGALFAGRPRLPRLHALHIRQTGAEKEGLAHHHRKCPLLVFLYIFFKNQYLDYPSCTCSHQHLTNTITLKHSFSADY